MYERALEEMMVFTTARELGMALRRLREDAGWSRDRLAEQASVSKRWLVNFENGKPSVDLSKVMDCFAVLGAGFEVVDHADQPGQRTTGATQ